MGLVCVHETIPPATAVCSRSMELERLGTSFYLTESIFFGLAPGYLKDHLIQEDWLIPFVCHVNNGLKTSICMVHLVLSL